MSVPSLTLSVALVLHLAAAAAAAPQPPSCGALTIPVSRQPIALTEQQESDLGDAVTEHTQGNLMIVGDGPDPYLQTLAGHIIATFERRGQLGVPSGPRFVRFNADGTRLLVVAADQRAMLVDPSAVESR